MQNTNGIICKVLGEDDPGKNTKQNKGNSTYILPKSPQERTKLMIMEKGVPFSFGNLACRV